MSTVNQRSGVRARRFSKSEYYRLGELGFFHGQRTELIEGRIMVQSPQKPEHFCVVDHVAELLRNAFGPGYRVRIQGPIDLGQSTEPEPDLAVVAGSSLQFLTAHPTTAALIVEVSESSLSYDRRRKGSLYARAGISDYWIVNLVHRRLEVYRDPVPDANEHYGHRYSTRTNLTAPATISPLALTRAVVAVADLIP